jgi:hypothetical protein
MLFRHVMKSIAPKGRSYRKYPAACRGSSICTKTPPRDARWLRHSIAVVFGGQICALPAGRSAEAAGEVAMTTRDPRIDACIAKAAPFAQPILEHVREVVHEACPDAQTIEQSAEGKTLHRKNASR